MASTVSPGRPRPWGAGAWPWVLLLLAVAVFGFWKPYFGRLGQAQGWVHLHTLAMLAWFAMLVAQPLLIRGRRWVWHRRLGKASYAVVPLIAVTALLLAQSRIRDAPAEALPIQGMILYLGMSATAMLLLVWGLGIHHRRDAALHARYMAGTALTMIDPALARVMIFWTPSVPPPAYQFISFGVVYAILSVLIVRDRHAPRGRRAFVILLGLFVVLHVSILLVPGTLAWQRIAIWCASP